MIDELVVLFCGSAICTTLSLITSMPLKRKIEEVTTPYDNINAEEEYYALVHDMGQRIKEAKGVMRKLKEARKLANKGRGDDNQLKLPIDLEIFDRVYASKKVY